MSVRRVACAWLACAALGAQAMTIREMRLLEANEKDGKTYASYYLVGVLEGLREAADLARRNGQKPLFCVNGRRLEPTMARSLYQGELMRNADSYEADMRCSSSYSNALEAFSCDARRDTMTDSARPRTLLADVAGCTIPA